MNIIIIIYMSIESAIKNNDIEFTKNLIQKDIDRHKSYVFSVTDPNDNVMINFLGDFVYYNPNIMTHSSRIVKAVKNHDFDELNKYFEYPFRYALGEGCYFGNLDIIKYVVSQGINLNCYINEKYYEDNCLSLLIKRYTPEYFHILQYLIENGVNTNIKLYFNLDHKPTLIYLEQEFIEYECFDYQGPDYSYLTESKILKYRSSKKMILFLIYDKKENEYMSNCYFDTNLINLVISYIGFCKIKK